MVTAEGCRHCGVARRDHAQTWHPDAGWHGWTEPTRQQIHDRIRARYARR
ncbi:hypothetical protein [Micromonospora sp. NPDC023633]